MIKRILISILILSIVFSFAACDKKPDDPLAPTLEYTISQANTEITTEDNANEGINTDSSWRANYTLKYTYTNSGKLYYIEETRVGDQFKAVDTATGDINYYVAIGATTVYNYILYPDSMTGRYSIEPVSMSMLVSKFMELSAVQPVFTTLSNVERLGVEDIIGRPTTKFRQTEKDEDGAILYYADVWIDNEFGFAIKCHLCLADDTIKESWDVTEFRTGDVTADDIGIDITQYMINVQ